MSSLGNMVKTKQEIEQNTKISDVRTIPITHFQ